jgi:hypothetical protein
MSESFDASPKPTLAEKVERLVSSHGIADTKNNFFQFQLALGNPEYWSSLPPALTYEEYMQKTHEADPELVAAAIAASDAAFIKEYDRYVRRINEIIADGIHSQQQADAILVISKEAQSFIDEFRRALPK